LDNNKRIQKNTKDNRDTHLKRKFGEGKGEKWRIFVAIFDLPELL